MYKNGAKNTFIDGCLDFIICCGSSVRVRFAEVKCF